MADVDDFIPPIFWWKCHWKADGWGRHPWIEIRGVVHFGNPTDDSKWATYEQLEIEKSGVFFVLCRHMPSEKNAKQQPSNPSLRHFFPPTRVHWVHWKSWNFRWMFPSPEAEVPWVLKQRVPYRHLQAPGSASTFFVAIFLGINAGNPSTSLKKKKQEPLGWKTRPLMIILCFCNVLVSDVAAMFCDGKNGKRRSPLLVVLPLKEVANKEPLAASILQYM